MKLRNLYTHISGSSLYGAKAPKDKDLSTICVFEELAEPRLYPKQRIEGINFEPDGDKRYVDLCTFLTHLLNGHPMYIESLFVDKQFIVDYSDDFKSKIIDKRHLFIDKSTVAENTFLNTCPSRFTNVYNSKFLIKLPNNPHEKLIKLANNIESDCLKYGFYRKEVAHAFRTLLTVRNFLNTDVYENDISKISEVDFEVYEALMNFPEKINFKDICDKINKIRDAIKDFRESEDDKFSFDTGYCHQLIKEVYSV